jgi:hypothetical protein
MLFIVNISTPNIMTSGIFFIGLQSLRYLQIYDTLL